LNFPSQFVPCFPWLDFSLQSPSVFRKTNPTTEHTRKTRIRRKHGKKEITGTSIPTDHRPPITDHRPPTT
jgi:hypothetical protein